MIPIWHDCSNSCVQITAINGRCDRPNGSALEIPIQLLTFENFTHADDPTIRGLIEPQFGPLIKGLIEEASLTLCATCTVESEPALRRPKALQVRCTISITVYGPIDLLDEIGEWFQAQDIYLQDPTVCHLDVRYCNPQRLSSADLRSCPSLFHMVSEASKLLHFQEISDAPDYLDIISGQTDLEETQPSSIIQAVLHRHQKQALTFMLRRELGWSMLDNVPDIWAAYDTSTERVFINRINNAHQHDPPMPFSGGIIADPMGLGKTLTMIALIAADIDQPYVMDTELDTEGDGILPINATLIIVTQPLLLSWEEQLSNHVVQGAMRYRRHHGKDRVNDFQHIAAMNIVLTTYHTLSADWKSSDDSRRTIFSVRWRRIVLDEAHLIRNTKTRMARALLDLKAKSRWAVTGTPIQNNLGDLAGLLKFIRAYPYDDPKKFETDFTHLWKAQEAEKAVNRLKYLASCLVLRRPKMAISLPARLDLKCSVELSREERNLYESVRNQAISRIEDALVKEIEVTKSGMYVNFLQQIESMRLVCNLGLHYHTRHENVASQDAMHWAAIAQKTFDIQREMNIMTCSQCSSFLDDPAYSEDSQLQQGPCFSRCLKYACADCSARLRETGHQMVCGHTPRCPVAFVSLDENMADVSDDRTQLIPRATLIPMPAKVKALVSDLQGLAPGTKSIVFSTWRMTLDVVEAGLSAAGISSSRFDGKIPQAQRQPVLDKFKKDPHVRVLLLTLQCGAVGLTLTEASRAYLMEPHWNPTVEEQALARIHRIGQTKEVTTVRFYIRESFEERIMETQDSKKNLASILLSNHDGGHADDSLGALQVSSNRYKISS